MLQHKRRNVALPIFRTQGFFLMPLMYTGGNHHAMRIAYCTNTIYCTKPLAKICANGLLHFSECQPAREVRSGKKRANYALNFLWYVFFTKKGIFCIFLPQNTNIISVFLILVSTSILSFF